MQKNHSEVTTINQAIHIFTFMQSELFLSLAIIAKEKKTYTSTILPSIWDQEQSVKNEVPEREPQELLLAVLPEDDKDKVGGL